MPSLPPPHQSREGVCVGGEREGDRDRERQKQTDRQRQTDRRTHFFVSYRTF